MNRKPGPLLVFLMLLAFTGQVLAAPLLACHQAGQMAVDEHGLGCCPMDTATRSENMDMEAMEVPALQEGPGHAASGSMECDQHCVQCLALTPRQAASAHVLPTNQVRAFETFILPFHLDGFFRPPISA